MFACYRQGVTGSSRVGRSWSQCRVQVKFMDRWHIFIASVLLWINYVCHLFLYFRVPWLLGCFLYRLHQQYRMYQKILVCFDAQSFVIFGVGKKYGYKNSIYLSRIIWASLTYFLRFNILHESSRSPLHPKLVIFKQAWWLTVEDTYLIRWYKLERVLNAWQIMQKLLLWKWK